MSMNSESGRMFWLIMGGSFLLSIFLILKKNPIIVTYASVGLVCILLLVFFLNFLHTVYLLKFDAQIRRILESDENETLAYFESCLAKSRAKDVEINDEYYWFISTSKIFDCE